VKEFTDGNSGVCTGENRQPLPQKCGEP